MPEWAYLKMPAMIEAKKITASAKSKSVFVQSDAPRSAALIEFGGPHSSDPDRPGAHHIAPINHAITSSGDHSRSDTPAAIAGLVRRAR